MRGARCTASQAWLAAAARPMSRAVRRLPGRQQLLAGGEVEAAGADPAAGADRLGHPDAAIGGLGILLQQDGIGAGRDEGAGEDAHRLAGADRAREGMAGRGACR